MLISSALVIWPVWPIPACLGLSGALSLAVVVPLLNIVMRYHVATTRWLIEGD